ncbi:MAG: hypothetical protein R6X19_08055 [Kiritimatiellia bacterium]
MNESLKEMWELFELEEFPEGSRLREVEGLRFEQVDALAAACVSAFIRLGALDAECCAVLEENLRRLNVMADLADEADQPYFIRLRDIAHAVRDRAAALNPPAPAAGPGER